MIKLYNKIVSKHACSIELAKKLKELGMRQKSLWYWIYDTDSQWIELATRDLGVANQPCLEKDDYAWCSAFTSQELGVMLPSEFYWEGDKKFNHLMIEDGTEYEVDLVIESSENIVGNKISYKYKMGQPTWTLHESGGEEYSEADARAEMVIWLIESELFDATILDGYNGRN